MCLCGGGFAAIVRVRAWRDERGDHHLYSSITASYYDVLLSCGRSRRVCTAHSTFYVYLQPCIQTCEHSHVPAFVLAQKPGLGATGHKKLSLALRSRRNFLTVTILRMLGHVDLRLGRDHTFEEDRSQRLRCPIQIYL